MVKPVCSVVVLCLVLLAKLSTTIPLDGTTEVLSHNVRKPEEESTFDVLGEGLRREEDTEYVLSVMSGFASEDLAEEKLGRRLKRGVMNNGKCSKGWIRFGTRCLKKERIEELLEAAQDTLEYADERYYFDYIES